MELDLAAIRQTLAWGKLRWVPTTAMPADGLTKHTPALRDTLRHWAERPWVQFGEAEKTG